MRGVFSTADPRARRAIVPRRRCQNGLARTRAACTYATHESTVSRTVVHKPVRRESAGAGNGNIVFSNRPYVSLFNNHIQ